MCEAGKKRRSVRGKAGFGTEQNRNTRPRKEIHPVVPVREPPRYKISVRTRIGVQRMDLVPEPQTSPGKTFLRKSWRGSAAGKEGWGRRRRPKLAERGHGSLRGARGRGPGEAHVEENLAEVRHIEMKELKCQKWPTFHHF